MTFHDSFSIFLERWRWFVIWMDSTDNGIITRYNQYHGIPSSVTRLDMMR